jgi:hypothetical protein
MDVMEPEYHHQPGATRGGSGELFVVTLAGTMVVAVAVLARLTWKHLRSRQISPADTPIVVE